MHTIGTHLDTEQEIGMGMNHKIFIKQDRHRHTVTLRQEGLLGESTITMMDFEWEVMRVLPSAVGVIGDTLNLRLQGRDTVLTVVGCGRKSDGLLAYICEDRNGFLHVVTETMF